MRYQTQTQALLFLLLKFEDRLLLLVEPILVELIVIIETVPLGVPLPIRASTKLLKKPSAWRWKESHLSDGNAL
jgi:hypothetical protein